MTSISERMNHRAILQPIVIAAVLATTGYAQPTATTEVPSSRVAEAYRTLVRTWLHESAEDVPNKCGLPALAHARTIVGELDGATRGSLITVLSRPTTQKSIRAGMFRIHYDTTGVHAPALLDSQHVRIPMTADEFADSVASILSWVLVYERDSLGYLPPPPDNGAGGGNEYDIYIQELGGSAYGSTIPEAPINNKPEGGTFTSFIVIDNDFDFVSPPTNRGLPALRVTIAHELHHAMQIGKYGFWQNDLHFYEMTSVWLEDVLYTEVNDYYQYLFGSTLNPGHFRRPDIAFTSNAFIMYSRGVWCHYLAKTFGRNMVRRIWEEIRQVRPLLAMDAALSQSPFASSVRTAFAEWSVWNFFTNTRSDSVLYYPEGRNYPAIAPSSYDYVPPQRTISDQVGPFGSRYYDITSLQHQRLRLVLTNLNVEAALTQPSTALTYTVVLSERRVDESYMLTNANIFLKVNVGDPTNWFTKDLFGAPALDQVFPNPFLADGRRYINVPVNSLTHVEGSLYIFSSSMDLVYTASLVSTTVFGKEVFRWDGKTLDGSLAPSGVYLYILETQRQRATGKFILVRK